MKRFLQHLLVLGVLLAACGSHAANITVFAAASLTDSLKEIATRYEKQSGDKIVFNYGASSLLARQIEEGAPADIFFSADEAKMNNLEKQGLILPGTRKSRLGNTLVIVVDKSSSLAITSPADLTKPYVKKIALADPKAVPAGIYSREYLTKLKLWPLIEPKVVPTDNVRAALAAVESGNVEAGMVYKTDAAISRKIKVAYEVPTSDAPNISYPMAVMKEAKDPAAAKQFLEYLASDEAGKVFEKYGFIVHK
ncbi:molybdate ABC transporter substrate-binding protein [Pedosphaera parvula]|uniref:Molybdenum ABC transporter, periplasmic molybdate-binding protein n=1 Tax=Pedosphaera parvula (strain Ellin514) TaxID=320771 RepID=B9XRL8_PEDPL|nr:molybdate ABC transporter substrate-binding protein [Pedosphaera parvula]EEF57537.1 molybdenum ABC transporter, periplasmic molybdate-binding protein [Pedosphaera parvula Ellin514]